jgi:hypothetical protein
MKVIIAIFILIILGTLISEKDQSNTSNISSSTSTGTKDAPSTEWVSGEGLTEGQWIARCQRYESARQACAVANRPGQCMEIKLSGLDKGMGDTYCDNGQPNWFLMGRR